MQASDQSSLKGLRLLKRGWGMRCDTARHLQEPVQEPRSPNIPALPGRACASRPARR